jgi:hypothetical protein
MSRAITICEKSSPSWGLNYRAEWAMISRMTGKFSRKTFSGGRLSGKGRVHRYEYGESSLGIW